MPAVSFRARFSILICKYYSNASLLRCPLIKLGSLIPVAVWTGTRKWKTI
jgi:hypothetical protein